MTETSLYQSAERIPTERLQIVVATTLGIVGGRFEELCVFQREMVCDIAELELAGALSGGPLFPPWTATTIVQTSGSSDDLAS